MADLLNLSGKTVLVTGASSGLGAHFAGTLAEAGAQVILAARREAALATVADAIRASGGTCETVTLDVTSSASIAAIEPMIARTDVLVNNAGIAVEKPFLEQTEEDWDAVLDTNLKSIFLMTHAFARLRWAAGKGGAIINIASVLGLRQGGAVGPYAASKAGAVQLTKNCALELARFGIRVNAICPGYYDTDINHDFWETDPGKAMIKRIPTRRIGQPSELAGALLLLASDAASNMTGSVIAVDGGHLVSGL